MSRVYNAKYAYRHAFAVYRLEEENTWFARPARSARISFVRVVFFCRYDE